MRILVLTTSYPRFAGDIAGSFIPPINEGLTRWHGHRLTVVAPHDKGSPARETAGGVDIRRFRYFRPERFQALAYGAGMPINLRRSWMARLQVPAFAGAFAAAAIGASAGCELIHAHWFEPAVLALALGRAWGVPVVLSVHRLGGGLNRLLYRHVLTGVDAVLFNSSYTMAKARRLGVPFDGQVVPMGAEAHLRPEGPDMRQTLGIAAGTKVVGTLGRLIVTKGHLYLIQAFRTVLAGCPDSLLLLGGDGPLRADLEAAARQEGIAERVRFLGSVSRPDVPAFLRTLDVFVMPSIVDEAGDTESFGVAALEAMACGRACVASRVGGVGDIVLDGRTGLMVEQKQPQALAAALVRLLGDADLRRRLTAEGLEHVERHFRMPALCAVVNRVYEQAVVRAVSR